MGVRRYPFGRFEQELFADALVAVLGHDQVFPHEQFFGSLIGCGKVTNGLGLLPGNKYQVVIVRVVAGKEILAFGTGRFMEVGEDLGGAALGEADG